MEATEILRKKIGVCHHFTKLFNALMYSLGYQVLYILGYKIDTSKSFSLQDSHAWSLIKINGKWLPYDVTNGISTFYAEILRIKDMSQYIKKMGNVPALCLIDEIFKGTNSADRIYGAAEAIKNLSSGNAMVIVSTHDFELCELKKKNGDCVSNYHFEEYYEDNELKFDYKIKEGRCTTRNAKALLSMAGLLELDNLDKN